MEPEIESDAAEIEVDVIEETHEDEMLRAEHYVGSPRLSAEEIGKWVELVRRGGEIREARRRERRETRNAERIAAGKKPSRDRVRRKKYEQVDRPPVNAVRWILARHAGLYMRDACRASGATWADVDFAKGRCEEVRCAMDAVEESSAELQVAKAMSLHEEALDGADVPNGCVRASEWTMERVRGGRYSDPRVKAAQVTGGQKAVGGGGIAVVLIADAAKAAAEPLPTGGAAVLTDV